MIRLATEGISYEEIAREFGVTRQRVYHLAKAAGIRRSPDKGIAHLKDPVAKTAAIRARADRLRSRSEAEFDRLRAQAAEIEAQR